MKPSKRFRRPPSRVQIQSRMAELGLDSDEQLIDLCCNPAIGSKGRVEACFLVGQLRHPDDVRPLIAVATDAAEPELIWEALSAVGAIGSRRATRSLLMLLRSTKSVVRRRGAVFALMQLADERARGVLAGIAGDPSEDEQARGLAIEALGLLAEDKRSLAVIISALSDRSVGVRYSALCAAGALRAKSALPAVERLLGDNSVGDGDRTVGDRAAEVIEEIRGGLS